ncbi:hypothetical protein B0F90DRAFT_1727490 [Multifurca ochricompacta]|uniref:Uncharacterized protein n=1 Tax=Multifurca ochricompacta TaxID=376703 RepID=A0AAD4M2B4_9AGAM|nr:hypothetical protein B0F90DRAFT_1727490 [Multifurca ochricompacta]
MSSGRTSSHKRDDLPRELVALPILIKSPFLLFRLVMFCLLVYMSLTALVFAAWNVALTRSKAAAGAPLDGASVLIICTEITTFLCIVAWVFFLLHLLDFKFSYIFTYCTFLNVNITNRALANFKFSFFSTSLAGFECAWTGIFASLQIAASIVITLCSPPPDLCKERTPLSICASTTILIHISWLAAITLLGYFITITALCIAHLRVHPTLWSASVYSILWFANGHHSLDSISRAVNNNDNDNDNDDDDDDAPPMVKALKHKHNSAAPQLPPLGSTSNPAPFLSIVVPRGNLAISTPSPPQRQGVRARTGLEAGVEAETDGKLQHPPDREIPQSQSQPQPQPQLRSPLSPLSDAQSPNASVWWDRLNPGRAGRDHPYHFRRGNSVATAKAAEYRLQFHGATTESEVATTTSPSSEGQQHRELGPSSVVVGAGTPTIITSRELVRDHDHGKKTVVGASELNEDEPIPFGDRSQWVRALQRTGTGYSYQ